MLGIIQGSPPHKMVALGKSAHKGTYRKNYKPSQRSGSQATWICICEHVPKLLLEPALSMLYEGLMEAARVGSGGTPQVCSGLSNFCRVTAEPRRENTKTEHWKNTKKVLKGKKRKRKGGGEERAGHLSSNGSYAKKQLTKNRLNREGKWGKNKMVWSQADKCTREKFTWF